MKNARKQDRIEKRAIGTAPRLAADKQHLLLKARRDRARRLNRLSKPSSG